MLHFVLSALLLLAVTSAQADWVRVGENSGMAVYVDPTTLVKDGDVRRAWGLQEMKWYRSDGVVSFKTLDDFNCKENRRRTVFRVAYAGTMATGKVLDSGSLMVSDFEQVYPFSPGAWQLEYVCGL